MQLIVLCIILIFRNAISCELEKISCENVNFYTIDGTCNNVQHPFWGATETAYTRLLPAKYADNSTSLRLAVSGNELPNPRTISVSIFSDLQTRDLKINLNNVVYGTLVVQDISAGLKDHTLMVSYDKCCTSEGQFRDSPPKDCLPIKVPEYDPVHSLAKRDCLHFSRTATTRDIMLECQNDEPVEQINGVNAFLDLSPIYGNKKGNHAKQREFKGGRVRVIEKNKQQWPLRHDLAPPGFCHLQKPKDECYDTNADPRMNQNPFLVIMVTLFLREHNRIAGTLEKLNPHWDDDTIFENARKIAIAEYQHITYNEWLPNLIGEDKAIAAKIVYKQNGFVKDYDENVNPQVLNELAHGAFRHLHSLPVGNLILLNSDFKTNEALLFDEWLLKPDLIEKNNKFDKIIRGAAVQPEAISEQYVDTTLTQYFLKGDRNFGTDIKSMDIQRGRDHGLATYNDLREYCGLPRAKTFKDFIDVIPERNIKQLIGLYESPEDVDFTVGGSLERVEEGALLGHTFSCVAKEQFLRTRTGDRFFFENGNNGFSEAQLKEIYKASFSRIVCDNGNAIREIQPKGLKLPSDGNKIVSCKTLPTVDLRLWKERK